MLLLLVVLRVYVQSEFGVIEKQLLLLLLLLKTTTSTALDFFFRYEEVILGVR
jgi:hypothetical protein